MLFQKTIVNKYKQALPKETTAQPWQTYQQYFLNKDIQQNILQSKEEQFQEGFLRELFVKVLGYTLNPSPDYNLITEEKNETNAKKADGAILLDGKVIGVIELKDHKTTDLSKIEDQAFGYKSRHVGTRLVIISNFEKLRLYIDNAVEYREWNLFTLAEDDFRELFLCLAWQQVQTGIALRMKAESVSSEDQITKALYHDYSQFKRKLFADILKLNPAAEGVDEREWQLQLFKKTQKLLDRLLFIFFAEDCGLLPPNSMVQIIDQWEQLKEIDEYRPFYDRVKKYFGYMNTGFKGKKYEVFAYNGGLFKPDEVLDNIKISDDLLVEHTSRLSAYDFESDVDVNILGHIFENSLSEIEEVTQQIQSSTAPLSAGEGLGEKLSKRKQDGVFYTPQYITKYIVENTLGRLCAEKKQELGIIDGDDDTATVARGLAPLSSPQNDKGASPLATKRRETERKRRLLDQLQQYREWLLQITILDPACGSGAFLNAALQFLMKEHKLIDEMETKVSGYSIQFQDVENSILENNLYGVDINEESVEIAQLALWLRTAKPHRKLNSLNQNIKCGNSLISDPAIAGDKAFNWQEQFPQVFRKKEKHAYHIVTATHDSRTSKRMEEKRVRELRYHGTKPEADPVILTIEEEMLVCKTIDEIAKQHALNIMAFNICRDHFHMLLVCEEKEVAKIVGMIKSKTAIAINKARGLAPLSNSDRDTLARGLAPLSISDRDTLARGLAPLSNSITDKANNNSLADDDDDDKGASPLALNRRDTEEDKGASPLAIANENTGGEGMDIANNGEGKTRSIWGQKFGCNEVTTREHLQQTMQYIGNNRIKHNLPPLPTHHNGTYSIAFPLETITDYDTAFRPEYDGGFDVVIGNPPYVQLQSMGAMSDVYAKCGYETYNKSADLYCLFTERGYNLLKPGGLQSFIMPNKWMLVSYGKELRRFMAKSDLQQIVNFGDIQFFNEATIYVCIFVTRKSYERGKEVQALSLNQKTYHGDFLQEVPKQLAGYPAEIFGEKEWIIQPKAHFNILQKMQNGTALKDMPISIYRGILTGYNDAFFIDGATKDRLIAEDPKSAELIKPLLRGRDIQAWKAQWDDQYLIGTFPSLQLDIDEYPAIKNHLLSFGIERLEQSGAKGSRKKTQNKWFETQDTIAYYEEFSKPKIMYPNMTSLFPFIYDEEGFFGNDKTFMITAQDDSVNLKFITAIFNSKLCKLWIWYNCPELQGGTREIRKVYFENFRIPIDVDQQSLADLTELQMKQVEQLQAKRSRFLRRLTENLSNGACPIVKITSALQTFDQLEFKAFVAELKKQKIKLSLAQQDEWEDYFNQYRNDCQQLSEQIAQTDREIDLRVYQLYGLTKEEIRIVELEVRS